MNISFRLDRLEGNKYRCTAVSEEAFPDGHSSRREGAWAMTIDATGSRHAEPPDAAIAFFGIPRPVCAGSTFDDRSGFAVTVVGFEDVETFGGLIRNCVRVEAVGPHAERTTEWHAVDRGIVRFEMRVRGALVAAGALSSDFNAPASEVESLLLRPEDRGVWAQIKRASGRTK